MNTPLISIIVPVYKVEQYLRKCVDSILAQTYSNIEVILVDDGSPDGCPAICDEYASKDTRVKVIHQANAGVSAARNAGLDAAKGDYIGFVDSDDWIEPDMYEVLLNNIWKTDTDIAVIDYCCDTEKSVGNPVKFDEIEILSRTDAIREMLVGKKYQGHMWTKLFHAGLFGKTAFSKEIAICEDLAMCVALFSKTKSIAYQEYHAYHYFMRSDSALHTYKESNWSVQTAYDSIIEVIRTETPKISTLAGSRSISTDISLAILAADNSKLDKSAYNTIKRHVKQYGNLSAIRLLDGKTKLGLLLFCFGRVPFIVGRKAWNALH